ncbi:hypothetical protein [Flagellimonas pacifica]|uniref:Uncharacterized protein n=1 Tax=Flagellimonas pacifica TaxID=1247520 RepID=A0A285MVE0_9FLAO|nr:hypothetical protein [Allomuricauda parva]SNY99441.1 hypothetical protein SAMN06265377_1247 [Allomuricauda parva]
MKKSNSFKFKKFDLKRMAMNIDAFSYKNIFIKLAYVQKIKGFPTVDVFENTQKAQENEWAIYGPDYDESYRVSFQNLNEIKEVKIRDVIYELKFGKHENEKYDYSKKSEVIDVYQFAIRKKQMN